MQNDAPSIDSFLPPDGPVNNSLAQISVLLSIAGLPLWCFSIVFTICSVPAGLLGIGGLVSGLMALRQIRASGQRGSEMAWIGTILGGLQTLMAVAILIFTLVVFVIAIISGMLQS